MRAGNEFQALAPATEKAHFAKRVTAKSLRLVNPSRQSLHRVNTSLRYSSAGLYTRTSNIDRHMHIDGTDA